MVRSVSSGQIELSEPERSTGRAPGMRSARRRPWESGTTSPRLWSTIVGAEIAGVSQDVTDLFSSRAVAVTGNGQPR